jgi:copper transport protein
MTVTRRRRIAGATLALVVGALALPSVAGWRVSAHAQLVASSPGAGEVVPEAPPQLVLIFSEQLEDGFSSFDLTDADGTSIGSRLGSVDPDDRFQLVADLPPLADGVYQVRWRSLSQADGHTASGFFSFGVGDVAAVPGGGAGHEAFEPDGTTVVGRWVGYLGLLAGFGLPILAMVVLRHPPRARIIRLVGGLMLLSALATLALAVRSGGEVEGGDIGAYLLGSRNGTLQIARAVALAAGGTAALLLAGRAAKAALAVTGGTALVGMVLLIAAGHASALPGFSAMASQVVHVAAAGVWTTGVVLLALVAWRPGLVTRQREPLVRCLPRFSAVALVSIGLVGVTGFFASWSQTGSLLDPGTEYGWVLLVKLLLAVGALAVGGMNFLFGERLTDSLSGRLVGRLTGRLTGLRPRLAAEIGLALAVLMATGLLSTTPPTDDARGVAIAPVPNAFGGTLPGMSMELLPGRSGVNQVAVSAQGAMGSASLELVLDRLDASGQARVPLRHVSGGGHAMPSMPGMDHGAASDPEAPARFVADAVVLPAGSRWDANVLVLTQPGGTELSRQRYSFEMGDAAVIGGRAGGVLDIGLLMAGVLLVGGALSIGLGLGGTRLPRCDAEASRVALWAGGGVAALLGALIGAGRLLPMG